MIRAFYRLHIVKAAHRHGVRAIRQAAQHARQRQADVAGVIGIAERLPLDVLRAVEVVADILNGRHLFHALFQEERRAGRADKRHVRRRRDFRNRAQQRDILRACVKLIRGNHRAHRLAAGGVILRRVGVPVQAALDDFRRVLEILAQILFGNIQNFGAHVLAVIGAVHQMFQAAPQRFHLLELRVVHHRVELAADLPVQIGDMVVEQRFVEPVDLLARALQALKENLHRGGHALTGGGVGQALAVLPGVDIAQGRDRLQVDFVKQRGVHAAGGVAHRCVTGSRRRGVLNRHQHFSR
ncbi:hypothetical protein BN133_3803 [Cronobacter dublinensis 582]|nr:hypothetical protein BN133_3803 [Cronobacter dublinensis 582]